ncbi:hypothetical protein MTTB_p170 (plasmid) [Methanothermobacter tenebrarum]|uniref:PGF-CTERM sorting domain-containing protein n=1 Tax=Methanothermobacter tenebrarum TaxID=680118 RepID=A0ABM7YFI7_9EURY|nr:hypothetical protein [Methanothermobacter tenebrarum]MBC7128986.1 hypothetical protein [Thermoplasmatales archaeon]BDH80237.1 hypothetical protein MTTB_p170 [Methanothermobacter tenebrarum]
MRIKNALITLMLLAILGASISVGTVVAQENNDEEIIIDESEDLNEDVENDEGLEEDLTNFEPAIDTESEGQEAAAGTVPMQPTGAPLLPVILSVTLIATGLLASVRYKF